MPVPEKAKKKRGARRSILSYRNFMPAAKAIQLGLEGFIYNTNFRPPQGEHWTGLVPRESWRVSTYA